MTNKKPLPIYWHVAFCKLIHRSPICMVYSSNKISFFLLHSFSMISYPWNSLLTATDVMSIQKYYIKILIIKKTYFYIFKLYIL